MTREDALKILDQKIRNKNLIKHCLAVEAAMQALAKHFKADEDVWGMAGLLHDLDYEVTANDWTQHGIVTEEWLKNSDLPAEIFDIIKAHNSDALKTARETTAEKAIFAVDPVTGLIIASALMRPDKKIKLLELRSVLKKFKNKKFAAGANREFIGTCLDLGLSLEEFIDISLKAMQRIDKELGL